MNLKEMIDELGGPDAVEFVISTQLNFYGPYVEHVYYVDESRYRVHDGKNIELRATDFRYPNEEFEQSVLKDLMEHHPNVFRVRRKNPYLI
jgi:hypothetical protein